MASMTAAAAASALLRGTLPYPKGGLLQTIPANSISLGLTSKFISVGLCDKKGTVISGIAMATSAQGIVQRGDWGEPIMLGTAKLPQDIDVKKLQELLYQWATSLTQNANVPFPAPLKVDRIEGGARLGYIRITDGTVEELVHIDVLVAPAEAGGSQPMFKALRNGAMKRDTPPGEPMIMQSLLAALKTSVPLARPS